MEKAFEYKLAEAITNLGTSQTFLKNIDENKIHINKYQKLSIDKIINDLEGMIDYLNNMKFEEI